MWLGPLEANFKQKIDWLRLLGVLPRDVLSKVYAAADVFTFPSRHETFGLALLEAMACGTPAAAYPADGPLGVLRDPVDGAHSVPDQVGVLGEAFCPPTPSDFCFKSASRGPAPHTALLPCHGIDKKLAMFFS